MIDADKTIIRNMAPFINRLLLEKRAALDICFITVAPFQISR